ncbi:MAG TPA: hypothetical protein ENH99_00960 [Candidatus Pacearchaeota archaeon]|nr:hypothetical protein [Candidatus Pacearchaeota archaeon]
MTQKKGCGKMFGKVPLKCGEDKEVLFPKRTALCPSCSGNQRHMRVNEGFAFIPAEDFDLSEKIKDTKKEIERQKKDIKAGRRWGKTYLVLLEQRLFYLEKFQKFIKKLKEEITLPLFELSGTYDECKEQEKIMFEMIDKLAEELSK